ncbi:MAG: aspartate ammonia-lyase [Paracoccaceae bacterium]
MNLPDPTACRIERDALGELPVPADAYFGIHTQRAVENFPISGVLLSAFPEFIRALAQVKAAAALANAELGALSADKRDAILAACTDIGAGALRDQFVVDMVQGGAGTSTNMNANEVIANLALEKLGQAKGRYDFLHPNDDVNASQSTNDVYPTAMRLAILANVRPLQDALREIRAAFEDRAAAFAEVLKVGRTQLQDAVPMTLGAEFKGFAVTVGEDIDRLGEAARLLVEVNLGGSAIGTAINVPEGYGARAVGHLARLSGFALVQASDLIEATSDLGAFVTFSGVLKRIAIKLSKICNDLRLLSSGPRAGLGEISLPAVQAGSSIMPGKVNPVIPEVMNQIAFQVIGADLTIAFAAEAGQLQLNAMEPVAILSLLQSMRMLTRGIETLSRRCVAGIEARTETCRAQLDGSLAMATVLVPILGYDLAARIAKTAMAGNCPMRVAMEQLGVTDPAAYQAIEAPGRLLAAAGAV